MGTKTVGLASRRAELPPPTDDGQGAVVKLAKQVAGAVTEVAKKAALVKLELGKALVTIKSDTGLIVHEFSEKAKKEMLATQMKEPKKGKAAKDPFADFKGSLYKFPEGTENAGKFGFPARAFKACLVNAANDVEMEKTKVKRQIRVHGTGEAALNVDGLIFIKAEPLPKALWTEWDHKYAKELEPYHKQGISMREDVVRLANGSADLRYRAIYPTWEATLPIVYNSRMISQDQLLALIDAAGFGVGVGEWRPSSPQSQSGQFGCFVVNTEVPILSTPNLR